MKHDLRHTKTPVPVDREPSRERDDDRPPRRDRRIGAAQLAAPPTRTWRRAGRIGSST